MRRFKNIYRYLSLILVILTLVGNLPIMAYAADPNNSAPQTESGFEVAIADSEESAEEDETTVVPIGLSGVPEPPAHWLQEYQKYAISKSKGISLFASGSPTYELITWGSGNVSDRITFNNGAFIGSPMPRISINGQVAFCAEWNGQRPSGNYTSIVDGSDSVIKQILANYDNSSKSNADYSAAQVLIWARVMGTSVKSWGTSPGAASASSIGGGSHSTANVKYNYLKWTGGVQDLVTYNNESNESSEPSESSTPSESSEPTEPSQPNPPTPPPVVVKEPKMVSFKVLKKDAETGQPIAGAIFEIREADGGVIGTFETGADGIISIDRIISENQTLIVTEIKASHGYRISEMPRQDVTLEYEGNVHTTHTWAVFHNEPIKKADMEIMKTDEFGKAIPNVTFTVKEKGSGISTTVTTGIDGKARLTEIEPTWYEIVETSCPEPYILDQTPHVLEAKPGETARIALTNRSKSNVEILKTSTDNRPLAGAIFAVYYKDNNVHVGDFTTNSSGKIMITNVMPGKWLVIKEKQAPPGYLLDETPKEVLVEANATTPIPVHFEDKAKPVLLIKKVDESDGTTPLAGAIFDVSYKDGSTIGQFQSNAQGIVRLDLFDQDNVWITVKEIKSPEGYVLSTESKDILLKGDQVNELIFTNKLKPNLMIEKLDSFTKQGIPGVEFTIERLDPDTNSWVDMGKHTTGADGKISLSDIPSGRYRYWESRPAPGYHPNLTIYEVAVDWNTKVAEVVENTPKHPIIIKKVDAKTGQPLAGATFRVTNINGELVGEYTTGRNGFVTVTDLDTGWYQVVEVKSPNGYILSDSVHTVELKADRPAVLELTNQPMSSIRILKYNAETKEPLAGVLIRLSNKNGEILFEGETTRTGEILAQGLAPGWYTVTELKPAPGFLLDENPSKDVELKWGEQVTVEFANIPIKGVHLIKLNSITQKPVADISFRFTKLNGELIGDFKTDKNGRIFMELEPGWYTGQELKSTGNEAYVVDEKPFQFEVKSDDFTRIERLNTPLPILEFLKVSAEDEKPLGGVKVKIFDEKMRELGVFTTTADGKIEFPKEYLLEGKFFIQEIETLPGYQVDPTVREFQLFWGKTTKIVLKNQKALGNIQIIKKAADDNALTKLKKDAVLEGAVFEIFDAQSKLVDTIATDKNGYAKSKDLLLGVYTIKEKTAPAHYLKNEEVMTAEIKVHGDLIKFEVYNKSQNIEVSVKKRGNVEVIAGDEMRYDFSEIENKSNVALDDFFWHDQLPPEVRIKTIFTGTWTERLTYKVTYKTNLKKDYVILQDNLSTTVINEIDCDPQKLGLSANEFITDIRFEFGTVQPGFKEKDKPYFFCLTNPNLTKEVQIINRTTVGGRSEKEWTYAKDGWVTIAIPKKRTKLPKTGY